MSVHLAGNGKARVSYISICPGQSQFTPIVQALIINGIPFLSQQYPGLHNDIALSIAILFFNKQTRDSKFHSTFTSYSWSCLLIYNMGTILMKLNGYMEKQLGKRLEHQIEATLYRALYARYMDA